MHGEHRELRQRAGRRRDVTPHELGRRAEIVVADELFARGFAVLARNVRLGALELDVVARRGPLVVVVEVRARGPRALVGPFESVTRTKRARLVQAVNRLWRRRLAAMKGVERVRIDVASVKFEGGQTKVEYAEGAITG
jgi:putative endonuclease